MTYRLLCRRFGIWHSSFDDGEPAGSAQRATELAAAAGTPFAMSKCS